MTHQPKPEEIFDAGKLMQERLAEKDRICTEKIEATKRETLAACCAAVCINCKSGDVPVRRGKIESWVIWQHVSKDYIYTCPASAIHELSHPTAKAEK